MGKGIAKIGGGHQLVWVFGGAWDALTQVVKVLPQDGPHLAHGWATRAP